MGALFPALLAGALLAGPASAFQAFNSPGDDGVAGVTTLTDGAPAVDLNLWIDSEGTNAGTAGQECAGAAGSGEHICAWDLHLVATGGVQILSFTKQSGTPVDYTVENLASPQEFFVNGGDPIAGEIGLTRIGTLSVQATSASGDLKIIGTMAVNGDLTGETVNETLLADIGCVVGGPGDYDCDGLPDGSDNCPFFATANQTDTNTDGIGDECQCGDQSGDGNINLTDIFAVNDAILDPGQVTPLCDTNNDTNCNLLDIFGVNDAILGTQAICARYPTPGGP